MNSYATTTDLDAWLADLNLTSPDDAEGMLRTATAIVAKAANRNPYTDLPIDTDADVLRDATTAQVASWVTLGITPAGLGLDSAPVKSSKLGSADVTYDTTGQADKREIAATDLAPEARSILLTGGLLSLDLPQYTVDTDPLADYGLARVNVGARRYPTLSPWWLS